METMGGLGVSFRRGNYQWLDDTAVSLQFYQIRVLVSHAKTINSKVN